MEKPARTGERPAGSRLGADLRTTAPLPPRRLRARAAGGGSGLPASLRAFDTL
ncbi:MAG: hypothetical protein AVDCRST_MAG65-293 [uncultured Solirubrobacteraceae bacterium]|uniref:Uncharacterized protein n=1 Tax=uncultured Solirubrobacteraceae bacterium TaxID=1162706 RepID=A0A6J4R707_9ACTN|nr:MAG: hypothetical protein AVDCRST_MAG65-293 [uncultured Solirubrobacteraceae bacterium]